MSSYEYVFFDLDGTLSDSAPGIINSVIYALSKMGVEATDREALKRFVGPPLQESFPMYYGFSPERTEEAVKHFRRYFTEKGIFENTMYDGIDKLLIRLRRHGKTLAVATSKPEPFARDILARYGIDKSFAYIAGSTLEETRTKKDEVLAYALESIGVTDSSKAVMVGDRSHDVAGAAKNSMDCIGVLYGYGAREELQDAGARYLADSVQDIAKIILE